MILHSIPLNMRNCLVDVNFYFLHGTIFTILCPYSDKYSTTIVNAPHYSTCSSGNYDLSSLFRGSVSTIIFSTLLHGVVIMVFCSYLKKCFNHNFKRTSLHGVVIIFFILIPKKHFNNSLKLTSLN